MLVKMNTISKEDLEDKIVYTADDEEQKCMSVLEEINSAVNKIKVEELNSFALFINYDTYINMTIELRKSFYREMLFCGVTKIVVVKNYHLLKKPIDYYVMNENGELELL